MTSSSPVWLITGCSSGLGIALARYVASQGHRTVATSRNPSKTPDLVSEIEATGGRWVTLDVTGADLEQRVQEAETLFGRIDILVNNAGYSVLGAVESISNEAVAAQIDTNFTGPLRIMKSVLPGMRARGSGSIINISSTQGMVSSPACGIYAASKFALEAVSEALSAEVKPFGIRVIIVEPGAFRTSFTNETNAHYVPQTGMYAANGHPVAVRFEQLKAYTGKARGDPEKAAKVIFEAVTGRGEAGKLVHGNDLLRLIIGPDSWQRIDLEVRELRRTVDLVKDVAASTDLPDGLRLEFSK